MGIPPVPIKPEMPQSALRAIRGIGRRETESLEAAGISSVDQVVALTPEELASLSGSTVPRARMLLGLARKLKESEPQAEAEPKEGPKPEQEPEPESSPKVEPE
jgi:nucleotidyltransferase/DNA polymerase involved in DNA repair